MSMLKSHNECKDRTNCSVNYLCTMLRWILHQFGQHFGEDAAGNKKMDPDISKPSIRFNLSLSPPPTHHHPYRIHRAVCLPFFLVGLLRTSNGRQTFTAQSYGEPQSELFGGLEPKRRWRYGEIHSFMFILSLIDWLIGWLIDWLIHSFLHSFLHSFIGMTSFTNTYSVFLMCILRHVYFWTKPRPWKKSPVSHLSAITGPRWPARGCGSATIHKEPLPAAAWDF